MNMTTRKLAAAGVTAAAYAALTLLLQPLSFGLLQFRVSEALCVLPALMPCTAWGLFIGCAAVNLLSPVGILDMVFGPLATLGAALCAAAIAGKGKRPLSLGRSAAVCLMPALWNGPVIGAVIAWSSAPAAFGTAFPVFAAQVAAEELGVLFLLGLPILSLLPRSAAFMRLTAGLTPPKAG